MIWIYCRATVRWVASPRSSAIEIPRVGRVVIVIYPTGPPAGPPAAPVIFSAVAHVWSQIGPPLPLPCILFLCVPDLGDLHPLLEGVCGQPRHGGADNSGDERRLVVGSATAVAPSPGLCGVGAGCLVSNEAASESAEHADAQARVGVGEGVMYQVAGVLDGAARAVIVSGGRVVISTAAGLASRWRRERPWAATMRGASAWVRVKARDGGIRCCVWIERGLRLMVWQAGVGRHRNGARCVGPRGSARVVVVCRSGPRPGILIITVIRGHNEKVALRRSGHPRRRAARKAKAR